MSVNIVITGASGRMGRALIRELAATRDVTLAGTLEAKGHPDMGKDSGVLAGLGENGVVLTDDPLPLLAKAQAVIDFTTPANSIELAGLAAQARIVHVIGTTGWSDGDNAKITAAARHAVIVKSGNMSLGVNMLAALVEKAARALPGYDVEILEMHHRMKIDAPSGTALMLGEAAAKGHGSSLTDKSVRDHHGNRREDGAIGFASLRGGTVIGEHSVILAGPGEHITLSHSAEDRGIFAHGAVTAALWGQGKKPGLYSMTDVLGF